VVESGARVSRLANQENYIKQERFVSHNKFSCATRDAACLLFSLLVSVGLRPETRLINRELPSLGATRHDGHSLLSIGIVSCPAVCFSSRAPLNCMRSFDRRLTQAPRDIFFL
jgi:hypothetical protein